jgi:hypothetical protein
MKDFTAKFSGLLKIIKILIEKMLTHSYVTGCCNIHMTVKVTKDIAVKLSSRL